MQCVHFCVPILDMLVDLKKLDEALKFVARANNLTLKGFLTGKGLQRGIIYYLKKVCDTPSLYTLEKVFNAAGLNPTSFIFTPSSKTVPFNPVSDLLCPEKIVTRDNLKLFFKSLIYNYGDYLMSLSFIHKFLSNEFPDIRMDLLIYGDKKHACLTINLSDDKILYIYFRLWHNKIYSCLADSTIPAENLNKVAYDSLTATIILKYLRIVDLNTTLIKTT